MKTSLKNINNLRVLSQVFSPPYFEKLVRGDDAQLFQKKITKYFKDPRAVSNQDIITTIYKNLSDNYRCEYIYKNKLFIDILKTYGLKDTLTLNEFKVGDSKADLVLLNGSIKIYEIKTELDGLGKLAKQVRDYQKFADKVYIVTDDRFSKKILADYMHTNAGIITLSKGNRLEILKEAKESTAEFNFDTIFKTLRKQEYLDITYNEFGFIPDVPNTKIFRACYELLGTISVEVFQKLVLQSLKQRQLSRPDLLSSRKTPHALKYLCNSLDFNEHGYEQLYSFLLTNSLCTNPT